MITIKYILDGHFVLVYWRSRQNKTKQKKNAKIKLNQYSVCNKCILLWHSTEKRMNAPKLIYV